MKRRIKALSALALALSVGGFSSNANADMPSPEVQEMLAKWGITTLDDIKGGIARGTGNCLTNACTNAKNSCNEARDKEVAAGSDPNIYEGAHYYCIQGAYGK